MDSLATFMGLKSPRGDSDSASPAPAAGSVSPTRPGLLRRQTTKWFGSKRRINVVSHAAQNSSPAQWSSSAVANDASWMQFSEGMQPSGDGSIVTCTQEQLDEKYAASVSTAIPRCGQTEFSVKILTSRDNNGGGILIGVAEDRQEFPANGAWGKVWGLAPWNGTALVFPDARGRDPTRTGEIRGSRVMRGDLRGSAAGSIVRVWVDMDERQLYFKVNSSEWMLARDGETANALRLSAVVRPFVRTSHKGDSFSIGELTHTQTQRRKSVQLQQHATPASRRPPAIQAPVATDPGGDDDSFRVKELHAQLATLKSENTVLRLKLAAETERRVQAERARDMTEAKLADLIMMGARRSEVKVVPQPEEDESRRARHLEAELLREAHVVNEAELAQRRLALAAGSMVAQARGNQWRSGALRVAGMSSGMSTSYAAKAFPR